MSTPTITQAEFFNLEQVKACQEIQKRNRFGSPKHRGAAETIYNIAVGYGAEEHFETIEEYDESVIRISKMELAK